MTHSHDTSTPAMSVESEYVLVLREPSDRMTAIGQKHRYDSAWSIGAIYRAMLDAAPAPNPSPAAKGGEALRLLDGNRPLPFERDELGRLVREAWVRWAETQPNPKPSWLVPYEELSEPDKEADRQIGEAVARWILIGDAALADYDLRIRAALATPSPQPADAVRERIARALNSVLGSEEDEHPRHHPAQKSWEKPPEVWWTQWLEAADVVLAALATPSPQPAHPDDLAVDRFAVAMKAKLADARAKGKGGWSDDAECSQQYLSDELRHHALKPDPLDVANFAMFLHQRNEEIALPSPQTADAVRDLSIERLTQMFYRLLRDHGPSIDWRGHIDQTSFTPAVYSLSFIAEEARSLATLFAQKPALFDPAPMQPADAVRKALTKLIDAANAMGDACNCNLCDEAIAEGRTALASDPAPATDDRERLVEAFIAGATAVHEEIKRDHPEAVPRGDPEFYEAAQDYARAALATEASR